LWDCLVAVVVDQIRLNPEESGLDCAEEFHYIGPDRSLDDYTKIHAERV
jgi:hypothetical protein